MKIAIDVSQIVYEGTGVSVYTKELVRNLLKIDKKNQYLFFAFSKKRDTIKSFTEELKKYSPDFSLKIIPLPEKLANIIGNDIHFPLIETFIGSCDIYHSSDWIQFPSHAKKITTVHDLVPFRFPEVSDSYIIKTHRRRLDHVSKECDRIISVSHTTKSDLVKAFNIAPEKVFVIYSGVGREFISADEDSVVRVRRKYNLPEKYILAVGTIEPRKNLNLLIESFLNLKKKGEIEEYKLIIVGKSGWGEILHKNEEIRLTGFIPTSDMPGIYKGASVFVYPSLYEGFGLPILEAMSTGCPVITSDVGSMKEISEESAVLIDPSSGKDLTSAILTVLRDKKMRADLIKRGKSRVQVFDWKKTAKETLSLYTSVTTNTV